MILPTPEEAFAWAESAAGPMLVCRPLEPIARHFFTTRRWPGGSAPGDEDGGWGEVARVAGVDSARVACLRQIHGAAIAVRRRGVVAASSLERSAEQPAADIIMSDDPSLALAIQAADCVPLLIADAATGVVAAVHAGWRGTAARAVGAAIDRLVAEFGSRRGDLIAAAGPAIGPCCYEVGDEVRQRFAAAGFSPAELARWFLADAKPSPRNPSMVSVPAAPRPGHWYFDGWRATRDQLVSAGVPADRIHIAKLCTASHPDAFHSYRRDGAGAGRLVAVIRSSPPDPLHHWPGGRHAH